MEGIILSRVKIYFKGYTNNNIQSNFDDNLSYLFHQKVNDLFEGTNFENFKFFTFSEFKLENGIINFIVSSVNEEFLRKLVSAFVMGEIIFFNNCMLEIYKVEFLLKPIFNKGKFSFITISPIFLDNCLIKDNLGDILEDLLINKFCNYYNLKTCPLYCDFYSRHECYDVYSEDNGMFKDYYYTIEIVMKGSPELIAFAYDVGLGNKNNYGFGMLDIY